MSVQAWMDMLDDPAADAYETLRVMSQDKAAFTDHPFAACLAIEHAGRRLAAELAGELPGLKIEFSRADADMQWSIFKVSFYMLGGWTSWNRALGVRDILDARRPPASSVADLIVIDAVGYFADRIRKGKSDDHVS